MRLDQLDTLDIQVILDQQEQDQLDQLGTLDRRGLSGQLGIPGILDLDLLGDEVLQEQAQLVS